MKPLEWLALAALGVLGYFFWKNSSQPSASPTCPAQTQLDGWLSDIATGKMSTDDANKLAASYALASPPCTDAVSAINAAIAAKGGKVLTTPGKAPEGAVFSPLHKPSIGGSKESLVPHYLTNAEASERFVDFADAAGFMGSVLEFLAANPKLALAAPAGGWPPNTSFKYYDDAYPKDPMFVYTPTGRFALGLPTYTNDRDAGEFTFASWNTYKMDYGVAAYRGPTPSRTTVASSGQRFNDVGVWVWEPGDLVYVKGDSVAATETAGVGFSIEPSPLLAAEPWR